MVAMSTRCKSCLNRYEETSNDLCVYCTRNLLDKARRLAEEYRDRYWSANSRLWARGVVVGEALLPWEVEQ